MWLCVGRNVGIADGLACACASVYDGVPIIAVISRSDAVHLLILRISADPLALVMLVEADSPSQSCFAHCFDR
jgi:hypothetical protein